MNRIEFGNDDLEVVVVIDPAAPPRMLRCGPRGQTADLPGGQPLVEIVTADSGHNPSSSRITFGEVSGRLRYLAHEVTTLHGGWRELTIRMTETDDGPARRFGTVTGVGLEAAVRLQVPSSGCALRSTVDVQNPADAQQTRTIRSVASLALRVAPGPSGQSDPIDLTLAIARNDWIGESRWAIAPLRHAGLEDIGLEPRGVASRGHVTVASRGTWSTGGHLASGAVWNTHDGAAMTWQIEHNGGWRFDLAEDRDGTSLALSGPTDDDHQWIAMLDPGGSFRSVPIAIAFGNDLDESVAAMTSLRRGSRREHPDNTAMRVVYNDYMNTLMGDPTTERLIPLIDAAARAGADTFVMDAGWYSDDDDWWTTVGQWEPSTRRFPGGMGEVFDRIRERGMRPGIWLEPEVVGVDSPAGRTLPPEAFFSVRGLPLIESERLHLDLRHPAARAHLDAVIDRLVADFGIGYFKLDYNVTVAPGTDLDADSAGAGLLAANRAHLDWLRGVLDRHPDVVLENCGSGAMRADWAMLSVTQLQSTSDQQEVDLTVPIAASAPFSMLPEQAANWAYPAADMTLGTVSATLAAGVLGRLYLSGFLHELDDAQFAMTQEAVAVHKTLRPLIRRATPSWPLGLDQRDAPWVAAALADGDERVLTLWRRDAAPDTITVPIPAFVGRPVDVTTLFPTTLPLWDSLWDPERGLLTVTATDTEAGARTLRLRASADESR